MSFTSNLFLVGFLPIIVLLAFVLKKFKYSKPIILLIVNIVFYIFGGIGAFAFVLSFSIVVWLLSLLISKTKSKLLFGLSIAITTVPLLVTKYVGFVVENINNISGFGIEIPQILMPLGISFFTFEAISLLCDIRMRKIEGKVSIFDTFLYLTFFATVTSGPIIRYQNFKD